MHLSRDEHASAQNWANLSLDKALIMSIKTWTVRGHSPLSRPSGWFRKRLVVWTWGCGKRQSWLLWAVHGLVFTTPTHHHNVVSYIFIWKVGLSQFCMTTCHSEQWIIFWQLEITGSLVCWKFGRLGRSARARVVCPTAVSGFWHCVLYGWQVQWRNLFVSLCCAASDISILQNLSPCIIQPNHPHLVVLTARCTSRPKPRRRKSAVSQHSTGSQSESSIETWIYVAMLFPATILVCAAVMRLMPKYVAII